MCSRFTLTARLKDLYEAFAIVSPGPMAEPAPRYNIAPTQPILVAARGPSGARDLQLVRWGLIPSWVKDPSAFSLLINARAETAAEKPSFRNAMNHRRVLVPASGFYEWRRPASGKGPGEPFLLKPRDGGLLFLAGLMETWSSAEGSEIDTAAILTTVANTEVAQVHARMPVIIGPRDADRWLDCLRFRPAEVADLMVPADPGLLEIVPVTDRINKTANTGADVQQPVGAPLSGKGAESHDLDGDGKANRSEDGQLRLF
ncbi:MAG: SOS response-associated peptidase [Pseudomonadota bacterium]|nr:SOS response-associated peptidase [Pseudomonadota bacterium]